VLTGLASLGTVSAAHATDPLGDPVVAAAGDIACAPPGTPTAKGCQQAATAKLLSTADVVLPLGDDQYNSGTLAEYQGSYDPTWGTYKAVTDPVPGNHEYVTTNALGYFDYFGAAAHPGPAPASSGYYSYDLATSTGATWHLIALNTGKPGVVPTKKGSPQETWLRADLASTTATCVLAYFHHPRFSAGPNYPGVKTPTAAIWNDLFAAHADVVLNGHDHDYQRFVPQDPNGTADPLTGITEFVVGTGGKSHDPIRQPAMPNLAYSDGTHFGVLKLDLHPASYDWSFVDTNNTVLDSGTASCNP
jgi:hypothetical protein